MKFHPLRLLLALALALGPLAACNKKSGGDGAVETSGGATKEKKKNKKKKTKKDGSKKPKKPKQPKDITAPPAPATPTPQ